MFNRSTMKVPPQVVEAEQGAHHHPSPRVADQAVGGARQADVPGRGGSAGRDHRHHRHGVVDGGVRAAADRQHTALLLPPQAREGVLEALQVRR